MYTILIITLDVMVFRYLTFCSTVCVENCRVISPQLLLAIKTKAKE